VRLIVSSSVRLTWSRCSDVVFLVGPDAKEIPAHRMFLAVRNPVFELMLYPPEGESQEVKGKRNRRSEADRPTHFGWQAGSRFAFRT
jgi:hypothetical protein